MHWVDRIVSQIREKYPGQISPGGAFVIRDEKTASGRVHVGSLRGVAIHGIVAEIFAEQGVAQRFLYEINDFDPMDDIPSYLERERYEQYLGKPLCTIPSPDGKAENYAEYFAKEFIGVIGEVDFTPEFYRSSAVYREGKYNETIKDALGHADIIRDIYKRVSGSLRDVSWFPLQVVCERCGKLSTTKVTGFDGTRVTYSCEPTLVPWAEGCGMQSTISPFDGNAKLPWKVEWAAKFKVFGVTVEGAGKDHSTKGGAREVAEAISQEVFGYEPPFDIPYEFFNVGGKKMSASRGAGASAREVADLVPSHLLRLLMLSKEPHEVIDFLPEGDTIPNLYDLYDKMAEHYFGSAWDDYSRLFELIHALEERASITARFLPRFSQVAFLVQMPHISLEEEILGMKREAATTEASIELTKADKQEYEERARYAKIWLTTYAPEDYKFKLQEKELPEAALLFSPAQKGALGKVLEYVLAQEDVQGPALHTKLHEIRKETGIEAKGFFSALYIAFLGKDHGPKAGWFLSALPKDFLSRRLEEASR